MTCEGEAGREGRARMKRRNGRKEGRKEGRGSEGGRRSSRVRGEERWMQANTAGIFDVSEIE